MQVQDILDIAKSKALGRDNYTPEQDSNLLRYLNLAHIQLYDVISPLDNRFYKFDTFSFSQANPVLEFPVLAKLFKGNIKDGVKMREVSLSSALSDVGLKAKQETYIFDGLRVKPTFEFKDAFSTIDISYFYVPEAEEITDTTFEMNKVYPLRLQYLLADGVFHHLCFAEEGTRPTRQQDRAIVHWERALSSERASLLNRSNWRL